MLEWGLSGLSRRGDRRRAISGTASKTKLNGVSVRWATRARVLVMGSRGFAGGSLLLCAAAALLLTPARALAKPRLEVSPQVHVASLTLKGTHGYEISIYERNREFLGVSASNLGASVFAPWSIAEYRIHQHRAGPDQISGKLPGLGRISVKFHPVGSPKREPGPEIPGCRGGGVVKQPGYFEGPIHLRGEQDFTTAHATRARGEVSTSARKVCKRKPESGHSLPSGLITAQLRANSESGGRRISFSVGTFEPLRPTSDGADIHASIEERRNGMRISRYVLASGREDVLQLGDDTAFPVSGTVSPPDPFRGSAAFERGSRGENRWTGSLSVPLPGAGLVSLTGPEFSASLCHEGGCGRY